MENALTTSDFDTMQRVSLALFKSKYFDDVESEAQAIVKVMAGAELGLPPFASMAGIHIIHGKPTLSSNIIATLVKNDSRYNYAVVKCDNSSCRIGWSENGSAVGFSEFTIEEAKKAGLASKDIWKKYPSDMLFARAISRGARRFAPGIFGGSPVYTPDELGADTDEEGYVIEVEPVAKQAEPESTTKEPDPVAAANAELLGHDGTAEAQANTGKAKDLRAETSPQEQVKREEHRPTATPNPANGNGQELDHLALALAANNLKDFALNAFHIVDGYGDEFNVVGALTQKWPEAHEQKVFRYTQSKTGEYLQWLADRKEAENG